MAELAEIQTRLDALASDAPALARELRSRHCDSLELLASGQAISSEAETQLERELRQASLRLAIASRF